jgi:hypothetical protein
VFKWYKAFSEGHESIKDEPRSGRPSFPTFQLFAAAVYMDKPKTTDISRYS